MIKAIYDDLIKRAKYALDSKSRDLVCQTYGEAKMARLMCAISKEQYYELNDMLIKKGLNNPKAGLE